MSNIENEIWKDVVGYEGFYQVSNSGRVKSLPRNGTIKSERIMKTWISDHGYASIILTKNNKTKTTSVHRLIAMAFIPNPENKETVNHKNGIKTDNRIENLEWCTNRENLIHAINTGLKVAQKGEDRPNSKLTEIDVLTIRRLLASGLSHMKISKIYKVQRNLISGISQGKRWKHVVAIILILFLQSCSANWHLKRAQRHERIALQKGAEIRPDTVYANVGLPTPEIRIDTVFRDVTFLDTLIVTKENVVTRVKVNPVLRTVYVNTTVKPDTIKIRVPVRVEKVIYAPDKGLKLWQWILIALAAGIIIGFILRKS